MKAECYTKQKKKQNQTEKGATYDVGSKSIAKL